MRPILAAAAGVLCDVDAACAMLVCWMENSHCSAGGEWYLDYAVRCSGTQTFQLFLTQCA